MRPLDLSAFAPSPGPTDLDRLVDGAAGAGGAVRLAVAAKPPLVTRTPAHTRGGRPDPQAHLHLVSAVSLFIACISLPGNAQAPSISESGAGAFEASLAALPATAEAEAGFVTAWYDTRDGNAEIYLRTLTAQGRPLGPVHRLTDDPEASYEADVETIARADAPSVDVIVAWYERSETDRLRARVGRWTQAGQRVWSIDVSNSARNSRNPVARVVGDELFVAWLEDIEDEGSEVWTGWWDADGRPLVPAAPLAPAGRTTWNLNATVDPADEVWVVFDATVGTKADELFLARPRQLAGVDRDSSTVTRLTSDDGFPSKYPDLAFGNDRAALTWFDERDGNGEIYLSVATLEDLREGVEPIARRVTETPGDSFGAYVTWNGRQFGLSWCDDSEGQSEVYFQRFGPDGDAREGAQRLTHNLTESSIPAIEPTEDGFALAWNEYVPEEADHQSINRSEIVFATVP